MTKNFQTDGKQIEIDDKNHGPLSNLRTESVSLFFALHDANEVLSIDCEENSFIFRWKPSYVLWIHCRNPVLVSPKPLINSSWVSPENPRSLLHWWNLQPHGYACFRDELVPPSPSQKRTETSEPLQKDTRRLDQPICQCNKALYNTKSNEKWFWKYLAFANQT